MKNAELNEIEPLLNRLFWWVPASDRKSLSPEAIVEFVSKRSQPADRTE